MSDDFRYCLLPEDRTFRPDLTQVARLVERLRAERWVLTPAHPRFDGASRHWRDAAGLLIPGTSAIPWSDAAIPLTEPTTGDWLRAFLASDASDPNLDELAIEFWVDLRYLVNDEDWIDEPTEEAFDAFGLRPLLVTDVGLPGRYRLSILVARDFVEQFGNTVECANTTCPCGDELAYALERKRYVAIRGGHVKASCSSCGVPFDPNGQRVSLDSHRDFFGWGPPTVSEVKPLLSHIAVVADFENDWPIEAGRVPRFDPRLTSLVGEVFGVSFEGIALFI